MSGGRGKFKKLTVKCKEKIFQTKLDVYFYKLKYFTECNNSQTKQRHLKLSSKVNLVKKNCGSV